MIMVEQDNSLDRYLQSLLKNPGLGKPAVDALMNSRHYLL